MVNKYIRIAIGGKEATLTRAQLNERLNLVAESLGSMGLRATGQIKTGWGTMFRLWFKRPIKIPTVLYVQVEIPND